MIKNSNKLFTLLFIPLFFSCNKDKASILHLTCNEDTLFIDYKKDIIKIRDNENGPVVEQWYYKNNKWYSCVDSSLQMSLIDTVVIYEKLFNVKLKTVVKKINENEFVCEQHDISLEECEQQYPMASTRGALLTSIIYYDKEYRIKRVIYPTIKTYTFKNKENPN